MNFNINLIIEKLKERRKLFVSEADMQLEMGWIIKEVYPESLIRMEYCPQFDTTMHIDILVIINGKWIPIELKYKTKKCSKVVNNDFYNLKTHAAKDIGCYLYLKDIERIETIKKNINNFKEGYSIFITNDLTYVKKPRTREVIYYQFSLEHNISKQGELDWHKNASAGTKKNHENPIYLEATYKMEWDDYAIIDDTPTGTFKYLLIKLYNIHTKVTN